MNELSVFDIRDRTFEQIKIDYGQINLDVDNYFSDDVDKAAYER